MKTGVTTIEFPVEESAVGVEPNCAKDRPAKKTTSEQKMTVVVVRGPDDLKSHQSAWQSLAENALEPNINYEPVMLLPAVEAFSKNADLYFVLLYTTDPLRPHGEKLLCGLFPLERTRRYKGVPLATFHLWKHDHTYLCTPLLHSDYASEALTAFFDWLESPEAPCHLMSFRHIAGDGMFHKLLLEELNKRGNLSFHDEWYNRALYKPHSADATFVEGISGRHKKELRRQQNRLAEEGSVEFLALAADATADEVNAWIEDFLRLEAGGWKGQEQTAFASSPEGRKFFEDITQQAFASGQLMMLALRFDGRPIAMKCNFLSGRGSFAFKIAFDESFARYSPGVLLELENLRRLAGMPGVDWMDSCAASEHFMINRLWTDRRLIETIVVSTGKRPADLVISALPLLRWFNRQRRKRR